MLKKKNRIFCKNNNLIFQKNISKKFDVVDPNRNVLFPHVLYVCGTFFTLMEIFCDLCG